MVYLRSSPDLTQSCCAFFVTLTTPTLYRRSLRWFDGCFQKPPPEGLPPSQLQLRADRLCSRVTPCASWFQFMTRNKSARLHSFAEAKERMDSSAIRKYSLMSTLRGPSCILSTTNNKKQNYCSNQYNYYKSI